MTGITVCDIFLYKQYAVVVILNNISEERNSMRAVGAVLKYNMHTIEFLNLFGNGVHSIIQLDYNETLSIH